jgi:hypothetical protein
MRPFSFFSALLLLTAAAARGQSAPPPATPAVPPAAIPGEPPGLALLRAFYAESIAASDRAVNRRWIVSLLALEKSRVAAGDYDGAERVRRRREEAISLAVNDDGRMTVRLSSMELTKKGSGLAIDESSGVVTVSSAGAFLEWDVSGELIGWYEVRLTHAVAGSGDRTAGVQPVSGPLPADRRGKRNDSDPPAGGWVSFENASSLGGNGTVLRREIVSTGGWNAWRTVSLGKLEVTGRIAGRIAEFKLTAEEAGPDGLMRFRELELVPVPPPGAAENGAAPLTAAREVFEKQFRSQTQATTNRYRDSLSALEQQALRAKDTDAVVRVREEKLRLQHPAKLALGTADETAAQSVPVTLGVGNGFNCQYRGEITLDSTRTSLTKLRPAGAATITWRLPAFSVASGTYRVELRGRVPANGGGTATLAAFGPSNAASGTPLKLTVESLATPEAARRKPEDGAAAPAPAERPVAAGVMVIGKGAETLALTVSSLTHADGWLLDLSAVTLTRATEPAAPKSNP